MVGILKVTKFIIQAADERITVYNYDKGHTG